MLLLVRTWLLSLVYAPTCGVSVAVEVAELAGRPLCRARAMQHLVSELTALGLLLNWNRSIMFTVQLAAWG